MEVSSVSAGELAPYQVEKPAQKFYTIDSYDVSMAFTRALFDMLDRLLCNLSRM